MYKFIVKFPETNESREYSLHPLQTILNLKERISVDFLHCVGSLILQCDTGYLEDHQVLNSLGIFKIEVLLTIRDQISISIQTKLMSYQFIHNYAFKISKNDTVKMLKLKVSKLLKFTPEIIGLKVENVVLKDSKTLSEYEINDNECILFGLNVYFLEINGSSHSKYKVITKFIEEDSTVSDLLSQYCIEENINFENVRCEYENKPLSDENIVDVMKQSQQPTLELKFTVKVIFIDKNENHCELFMFPNETIAELRNKLNNVLMEKLNETQVLLINNTCLENQNALKFYGPSDVYEVYCGFLLHIISDEIDNCNPSLCVHSKMRILDIKRILSNNHSVNYDLINLMLGDIQLEDTRCIDFYGIDESSEIVMRFGMPVLIWAIDELVEYIVKTETRIEDIRRYVAFRKRISNHATVTLSVDQDELYDSDNLIELARHKHDLIITAVRTSVVLEIELKDPRLPVLSIDTWSSMTIGQLKQSICSNYRTARKDSIRLWWVNDLDTRYELVDDNETVEASHLAMIGRTQGVPNRFGKDRLRLTLQDRIALIDEVGQIHSVVILPHDSIGSLKRLVSLKLHTSGPLSDIHLFLDGLRLDDDRSIEFYNLDLHTLLELKLGRLLRVSGDTELEIIIPSSNTVGDLRSKLLDVIFESSAPATDCRLELVSEHRELDDTDIVGDLVSGVIRCRVVGTKHVTLYVCNLTKYGNGQFVMTTVETMSMDTVESVKTTVLQEYCPDCEDCRSVLLAFLGDSLPDDGRLTRFGIGDRDVLMLKTIERTPCYFPRQRKDVITVRMVVTNPNGGDQPISDTVSEYFVDDQQLVGNFKQIFCEKFNVPLNSITLTYEDTVLVDGQSFCDLDLESHSIFILRIKAYPEIETNKFIITIHVKYSAMAQSEIESIIDSVQNIEIDCRETVGLLRAIIESTAINCCKINSFVLVFNEQIMADGSRLDSYGLVNDSVVDLCHSVLVQQQCKDSDHCENDEIVAMVWRVPIQASDSVYNLMNRIGRTLDIGLESISLYYRDSYLRPDELLIDAHICNDSLITLVVTMTNDD